MKNSHEKNKTVLMITHNYPPVFTTGTLRVVGFTSNLPQFGWKCRVLTMNSMKNNRGTDAIPPEKTRNVRVDRVFALNSMRDLAFKGRHFAFTAYPDQYITWFVSAFCRGYSIAKNERVSAIYSTFPVSTSHLIGMALCKILNKPWIADFRDPMVHQDHPLDKKKRKILRWIEKNTVINAKHLLFTTKSARQYYLERYPFLSKSYCHVVPNGYNEEDFSLVRGKMKLEKRRIHFIHAGRLYPNERDPMPLFQGLRLMLDQTEIKSDDFNIDFFGQGEPSTFKLFQDTVKQLNLTHVIRFLPTIPHDQMIQEMTTADALLLMQGANCDYQIPAKVYEYFRIGKPVLALTTESGDTGRLILDNHAGVVAPMDNPQIIAKTFERAINSLKIGKGLPTIPKEIVPNFSRQEQANKLSNILDSCIRDPKNYQ